MRQLLLSALLFSSCAALRVPPESAYCGNVDVLAIHVKNGSSLTCEHAMRVSNDAYELLWQKAAGPLNENWQVEYTWGIIDVTDASAKISPREHLIVVQEASPHNLFHELLHAYMTEMHTGGRNQHKTMCANAKWRQLEKDFGVPEYCHLMYLKKAID